MIHLIDTFAALGDSTRFAIIERLLNEGELSAGDLQEGMEISAPAISRHLKVLRSNGLILQRVDKQRRMYSVRSAAIEDIIDWTMNYREFWESSLNRLAAALEEEVSQDE